MDDIEHEADVVRMYVAVWSHNRLGDEAASETRARVLDAVERLLIAARQDA